MTKPESDWPVSFEANRADQARRWAATSPAQRLRWLQDAVRIALYSGALEPRHAHLVAPHLEPVRHQAERPRDEKQ